MISGNQYVYPSLGTAAASTNSNVLDCRRRDQRGARLQLRHYEPGPTNPGTGPLTISGANVVSPAVSRINGNKGIAPGQSPFAGSTHPGIVIVALASGSTRPLNDNMNFAVYASLFTPGGSRRGQAVIGDNGY